ncbi:MAG: GAF domain-containing protein [Spirochaetes bacterium]|nr:GAF domain-containing protein [Spirochaetota bacterium]
MGLIEKAMQYKRELNRKGEETLIDRITGPADTEIVGNGEPDTGEGREARRDEPENDILVLDRSDLVEVAGDGEEAVAETPPSVETAGGDLSDALVIDDDWVDKELMVAEGEEAEAGGTVEAESPGEEEEVPRKPRSFRMDDVREPVETAMEAAAAPLPPKYEGSFKDFMVLYETGKEIVQARSEQELFDTLIFLIMGQIAVSSVSIMTRDQDDMNRWTIAASMGVSIDENISFDGNGGLLRRLSERREILDVEGFSRDDACKDEYLTFISIDARILVPMVYPDELIGIVVIGNKISTEDFTAEEMDFLHSVSRFAVMAYYTLAGRSISRRAMESLNRKLSSNERIQELRALLYSNDTFDEVKPAIQKEMHLMGVDMYAFYMLNEFNNRYLPVLTEEKDFLSIRESGIAVGVRNGLIQFVQKARGPVAIDEFTTFDAVAEVFSKSQIQRMSQFRMYPFHLGNNLVGFLAVFQKNDQADFDEIDHELGMITDLLFPYIISMDNVRYSKRKYVDTVQQVHNRINEELNRVRTLGIPLVLVELAIKNFKRYYSVNGVEKAQELMVGIEELVKSKLSDVDFSIRHDRNKILIILPGKNKEYAVPMANALKNEIIHGFSSRDLQLLVTYITSEYPRDGEDLFSLIDSIE